MILARLYGIAETLNPWENADNKQFARTIKEWTDEFMGIKNGDLLKFFEQKTRQKGQGTPSESGGASCP